MELKITTFYCLCDDFLISKGWRDDPQCTMSTAEVMTAALTAAAFFSGSYEKSRVFFERHGYMPAMLAKSQFSRRLSSIPESVWRGLTKQLAAEWQTKAKKPGKGMETQRKPLLREQSSDELMLEGSDSPVYVKVEDFSANWLVLRKWEKMQANCPQHITYRAESKYKTYRLLERYLKHGDQVTAQGRLSRNADGRLFIKPTKRLEYPSFVAVETELAQLISTITDKASNDAWAKRINVGFLLINLCLLWR